MRSRVQTIQKSSDSKIKRDWEEDERGNRGGDEIKHTTNGRLALRHNV